MKPIYLFIILKMTTTETRLNKFFHRLNAPNTIIQFGYAETVLTTDFSKFDLSKQKNLFFLPGVKESIKGRAKNDDIFSRNHFFIDLDLRKDLKLGNTKEDTDKILEVAKEILEKIKGTPFENYTLVNFTGNGIHLHYIGSFITITPEDIPLWKLGVSSIYEEFEALTGHECDYSCSNVGRICRVPGSINEKKGFEIQGLILKANLDKESELLDQILTRGSKLKKEREEAKPLKQTKTTTKDGSTFDLINSKIRIEDLIQEKFPEWHMKQKGSKINFYDSSGKGKGFFVCTDKNMAIDVGTDHFAGNHSSYSWAEKVLNLSGLKIFEFFEERDSEIKKFATKERKEFSKKREKEIKEKFTNIENLGQLSFRLNKKFPDLMEVFSDEIGCMAFIEQIVAEKRFRGLTDTKKSIKIRLKTLIREWKENEKEREALAETKKVYEMSEEEKEEALKFLQDPNLIDQIIQDITLMGYIEEEGLKLLTYLTASSYKQKKPLNLLIKGSSSSGKSDCVKAVRKLMPEESVLGLTRVTKEGLSYFEEGIIDVWFTIEEQEGADEASHSIRVAISEGGLATLTPEKSKKTGKMSAKPVKVPFHASVTITTTEHTIHPENETRFFSVYTDESEEQTKRINEFQKEQAQKTKSVDFEAIKRVARVHKNAQRLLQSIPVRIPFADHIDLPFTGEMRSRRDMPMMISLIQTVAFLRQFQKEKVVFENGEFGIDADLKDYEVAQKLLSKVFHDTSDHIPQGSLLVVEKMLENSEFSVFYRQTLRQITALPESTLKRRLEPLIQQEILEEDKITKPYRYRLLVKSLEEIKKVDISLKTAEQIQELIDKEKTIEEDFQEEPSPAKVSGVVEMVLLAEEVVEPPEPPKNKPEKENNKSDDSDDFFEMPESLNF